MRRILLTLLGLIFIPCGATQEARAQEYGWVKIAQPANAFISAISFVDSLNGWIGCILADADKSIFRTQDGGYTWQRQISPSAPNIQSIGFVDPLSGWIVGNLGDAFGYIIHTSTGGQTWQEQRRLLYRNYLGLGAHNPLAATVTGGIDSFFTTAGLIVRTTNGGQRWQEQRFLKGIGKADFVDALHGWAMTITASDSERIIRTIDGGKTWDLLPYDFYKEILGLTCFDFIDSLRGWGVGRFSNPWIVQTVNSGTTWKKIFKFPNDNTDPIIGKITFGDTLRGWAFANAFINGGLAGVIYRTTDGGRSWTREIADYSRAWSAAYALNRDHIWAGSTIGEVWRYMPITKVEEKDTPIPKNIALLPNYPNPFNPSTTIEYFLPQRTPVVLTVTNLFGQKVSTLAKAVQGPGNFRVLFEAKDLPNGVYYYTLKTNGFEETKSMTLLK